MLSDEISISTPGQGISRALLNGREDGVGEIIDPDFMTGFAHGGYMRPP